MDKTIWQSLSTIVRHYRDAARQSGLLARGASRETAALLALADSSRRGIDPVAAPELVNIAALALSLQQLVAHQLRPETIGLVDETDLHALPNEPPRLLRRAWIIEAEHPERGHRLFADIASLGGYELDGRVCLIGLGYPDGCRVAWWRPRWTGEDLEAGVVRQDEPLLADLDVHHVWTQDAARFAVVFGLLLDAAGSPVIVTDESDRAKPPPGRSKKEKPLPAWVTRYVSLSPAPWAQSSPASSPSSPASPEGREAAQRPVRGHLKRQRHGPGGQEVRWIWVESYEARRWLAPAPRRVVVSP